MLGTVNELLSRGGDYGTRTRDEWRESRMQKTADSGPGLRGPVPQGSRETRRGEEVMMMIMTDVVDNRGLTALRIGSRRGVIRHSEDWDAVTVGHQIPHSSKPPSQG